MDIIITLIVIVGGYFILKLIFEFVFPLIFYIASIPIGWILDHKLLTIIIVILVILVLRWFM